MTKPIKVLLATGTMNAGGAEALIMEMLRHKSERIEYTVLVHYAGQKEKGVFDEEIAALGVPMQYIPSVGSVGQKQYTEKLREINEAYGPFDVIHSHLNAIGGAIAKAAKAVGIPSRVVHCHADITFKGGFISRAKNEALLQLMRGYINRYANHFWACSPEAAKRLFYRRRLGEAVVIPNIIDVPKYLTSAEAVAAAKKKYALEGKKVIGAVGRIAPIKNYEFIIWLLKLLRDAGEEYTFVCFGRIANDSYYRELLHLEKELGIEEQVRFLGNSEKVAEDIHCIDMFLMPSHSEGFGMAAIEAQAAGIPTIVSTGVPKIVDVGAGLIAFLNLHEPEAWAQHILALQQKRKQADNAAIVACFNQKGLNAETAIEGIENRYLEMARKDNT